MVNSADYQKKRQLSENEDKHLVLTSIPSSRDSSIFLIHEKSAPSFSKLRQSQNLSIISTLSLKIDTDQKVNNLEAAEREKEEL